MNSSFTPREASVTSFPNPDELEERYKQSLLPDPIQMEEARKKIAAELKTRYPKQTKFHFSFECQCVDALIKELRAAKWDARPYSVPSDAHDGIEINGRLPVLQQKSPVVLMDA